MLWLPYQGWSDVKDEGALNVTYYKSDQPLLMHEAWRKNNPKNTQRPYCVIARMGGICKDINISLSKLDVSFQCCQQISTDIYSVYSC